MRTARVLFLLLGMVICCYGQEESLLIGPGDLLQVQVLEAPELAQTARVTDSGMLPLILGGNVKVVDLIPSQAADAIAKVLVEHKYLLHPHVSVVVTQFATHSVTVLGQVATPGVFPLMTPRTVVDVLALAGGLKDTADRTVTIKRYGTTSQIRYFVSNDAATALRTSVDIYPGDEVIVPKASIVYVLGDVFHPGGYPMVTNDSKMSVLQAVTLAGSTQPSAVPSRARLIRKQSDGTYVEMHIQLNKMMKGKASDMQLQADDILYVPFSYLRNMGTSLGGMISASASAAIYRY